MANESITYQPFGTIKLKRDKTIMRHLFIVLEGVDGTGKTSVAKGLAKSLNAEYILTPMTPIDDIQVSLAPSTSIFLRQYVNDMRDLKVRFCYYLWAVTHASHRIREILESRSVVCDRYLSSTLAYHAALDPELTEFDVSKLNILRPDYEFLLTVSDEIEWQRRLGMRPNQNRGDEFIEKDRKLLRSVEQEYYRLGVEPIDTSQTNVDEVIQIILEKIRGRRLRF